MKLLKIVILSLLLAQAPLQADPGGGWLFGFLMTVIAVAKGEMLKKPINWAIGKGTKILAAIPSHLKPTPRDLAIGAAVATPTIATAVYEGHQAHKVLGQHATLKTANEALQQELAASQATIATLENAHKQSIGYKFNETLTYLNAKPFYAVLAILGSATMLWLAYKGLQKFFTPSSVSPVKNAKPENIPTPIPPTTTTPGAPVINIYYVDGKKAEKEIEKNDHKKTTIHMPAEQIEQEIDLAKATSAAPEA